MRQILAQFDEGGIFVYQAFKAAIADEALRLGTFGKGFNLNRMTWIKPSFGWMLYRSGYATKQGQERILKIKLCHAGFQTILAQAIPSSYNRDLFTTKLDWERALKLSEVRYQWDPDRSLRLQRLERRAIQLGIQGSTVRNYVRDWILGIEDVTALARSIHAAIQNREKQLPLVLDERVYPVASEIKWTLAITTT